MESDSEIFIPPPMRDEELEPLFTEQEQLDFKFGDVGDIDVNEVYSVMGRMTRADGSLKYSGEDMKILREKLRLGHTDLTLVGHTPRKYTNEMHNAKSKLNKLKRKRLQSAIVGLLEYCASGKEKELVRILCQLGWFVSLEDTACLSHKKGTKKEDSIPCLGTYKLANKKKLLDSVIYRCRVCDKYQFIRKNANMFFKLHNKIPIAILIRVVLSFLIGIKSSDLALTTDLTLLAIQDIYRTLRELIYQFYTPQKIGGYNRVVELDEMYWIRRMKYLTAVDAPGLPREKHTYLLFGGVERESGKIRITVLTNREGETLLAAVQDLVNEGSILFTDSYAGYDRLSGMGYEHYHLIKPSYVDAKAGQPRAKNYLRQRLSVKALPTIEQEMKLDMATIYREKMGNIITAYSSTAGIENIWKQFRKFYRIKGRINKSFQKMYFTAREFEWRYNHKDDLFNSFAPMLQAGRDDLEMYKNERTPERIRMKRRESAKKTRHTKKLAKFVARHMDTVHIVLDFLRRRTPLINF